MQNDIADITNDLNFNVSAYKPQQHYNAVSSYSSICNTSIILNQLKNVPMTAERLKTLDDLLGLDDDDESVISKADELRNLINARKAKDVVAKLNESTINRDASGNNASEPVTNGALIGDSQREKVTLILKSPAKCILKTNELEMVSERSADIEPKIPDAEREMSVDDQRYSDEKRSSRSTERRSKRSDDTKRSRRSEERRSRRSEERRSRRSEERRLRKSEERRPRRSEETRSRKSEERRSRRSEERRSRRSEERRSGRDERRPRRSEERRYRREETRVRHSEERRIKAACPKGPRTPPNTPPPHNVGDYDDHLMGKVPDGMDPRHMSYHDHMTAQNHYHQVSQVGSFFVTDRH